MDNFFEKNKNILVKLFNNFSHQQLKKCANIFKKYKKNKKNKIIFFGNGGSASICNHVSVIYPKMLRLKHQLLMKRIDLQGCHMLMGTING